MDVKCIIAQLGLLATRKYAKETTKFVEFAKKVNLHGKFSEACAAWDNECRKTNGIREWQYPSREEVKGVFEIIRYRRADWNGANDRRLEREEDEFAHHCSSLYVSQHCRCAITGMQVELKNTLLSPFSLSVDRLDNTKRHIEGNVIITTHWANRARSNLSVFEFWELLGLLANTTK
jgi:hypothetical protein